MSPVPRRPDITPLSSPEREQDSDPAVWLVVLSSAGQGREGEASAVPVGCALEQRGCEVLLGMVPTAGACPPPPHQGTLTLAGPIYIKAPCTSPILLC